MIKALNINKKQLAKMMNGTIEFIENGIDLFKQADNKVNFHKRKKSYHSDFKNYRKEAYLDEIKSIDEEIKEIDELIAYAFSGEETDNSDLEYLMEEKAELNAKKRICEEKIKNL